MGFSYDDWLGVFYPRGTKPGDWLEHYAKHFDAVELDTTFHAIPPVERVRRWASVVPMDFRFCMKAPKAVTHEPPVDRRIDLMRAFVEVARHFEERLGVILLQFPPSYTFEQRRHCADSPNTGGGFAVRGGVSSSFMADRRYGGSMPRLWCHAGGGGV